LGKIYYSTAPTQQEAKRLAALQASSDLPVKSFDSVFDKILSVKNSKITLRSYVGKDYVGIQARCGAQVVNSFDTDYETAKEKLLASWTTESESPDKWFSASDDASEHEDSGYKGSRKHVVRKGGSEERGRKSPRPTKRY